MADTIKKDARRSFSNTVSAGLKSLGGKGKTFYVLEFKNNSQMHKAKTTKEIIVDYIELGRSPKCQIRFGEDCRTVSGVHCAIMREGEHYFVKHLSKVNPTLINGKPVADKFYINSGDEITLSYGGPIIGFIVPNDNRTSTIPLTRRLSLFREQAMRPYKRAIAILSVIMILSIAGLSYSLYRQSDLLKNQEAALANLNSQRTRDSIDLVKMKENGQITEQQLKTKLSLLQKNYNDLSHTIFYPHPPPPDNSNDVQKLSSSVYYIRVIKIEAEIGSSSGMKTYDSIGWSGTGFLLDDGRFVTARHVIQGWYFPTDEDLYVLNYVATSGKKVIAYFKAWSPSGDVIEFTSDDFLVGDNGDKKETITDSVNNRQYDLTDPSSYDDWACSKKRFSGGKLKSDGPMSVNLQMGAQLFTLGFPFNIGALDRDKLEPQYSQFVVSSSGISSGAINISSKSFDHGNSGGPVFVKQGADYKVVGIVSAGKGAQGLVMPISKIN